MHKQNFIFSLHYLRKWSFACIHFSYTKNSEYNLSQFLYVCRSCTVHGETSASFTKKHFILFYCMCENSEAYLKLSNTFCKRKRLLFINLLQRVMAIIFVRFSQVYNCINFYEIFCPCYVRLWDGCRLLGTFIYYVY